MSFIWPLGLLALLVVPLVVAGYIWVDRRSAHRREGLGTMGQLRDTDGRSPTGRRHLPFGLFVIALILLLAGFARPEMVVDLPRVEGTVILAIDNSNSMRADDIAPTRIEAARQIARGFIDEQPATVRVGVVSFSNGAAVVAQPTDDHDRLLDTIERIEPEGGTSISQGLFAALGAIRGEPIEITEDAIEAGDLSGLDIGTHGSSIIVLLSDGEYTDAVDPRQVAQLAANARVRIFPIALGTDAGAIFELDGFQVATSLDAAALSDIAGTSSGRAFDVASFLNGASGVAAADTENPSANSTALDESALGDLYDEIDLQLTIRGEEMEITALLGAAGAILLAIGSALSLAWFGRIL